MRDSIYTIPISEVFEPKCGCPICTLQDILENRCIEYILGAAMMEPDIRIETNKYGFCHSHYQKMCSKNSKLPLALMIKSHLEEIAKYTPTPKGKKVIENDFNCFVCKEIHTVLQKLAENTIILYGNSAEFRTLFSEQQYFCYPHFKLLCDVACNTLPKKVLPLFIADTTTVMHKGYDEVYKNISDFTLMFDYRNANKEKTAEVTSAIESSIKFLSKD